MPEDQWLIKLQNFMGYPKLYKNTVASSIFPYIGSSTQIVLFNSL